MFGIEVFSHKALPFHRSYWPLHNLERRRRRRHRLRRPQCHIHLRLSRTISCRLCSPEILYLNVCLINNVKVEEKVFTLPMKIMEKFLPLFELSFV